jgi:hypothetical protein
VHGAAPYTAAAAAAAKMKLQLFEVVQLCSHLSVCVRYAASSYMEHRHDYPLAAIAIISRSSIADPTRFHVCYTALCSSAKLQDGSCSYADSSYDE